MEAWRWALLALLVGLGTLLAWWLLWPHGSKSELQVPLPYKPEQVCRAVQQVLVQYRYEISAADCQATAGWLRAAVTFIPDKSGRFIPDKSGSLRNELSVGFQELSAMGTLLKLRLRTLRFDPAVGAWKEDPRGPVFLSAREFLRLLARRLSGG
jgi:hypothetical protein